VGKIRHTGVTSAQQFPDVIPLPGFDAVEQADQIISIFGTQNSVFPERSGLDGELSNRTGTKVLPPVQVVPAL